MSGSVAVVSDYRYRGVSFSDGEPAVQAGVAYDDASGVYAGLFASTVRFATPPRRGAQGVVYAGYAHRAASGVSAEVGADWSVYSLAGNTYRYPEFYVGIGGQAANARLYYAPRYYGSDADTYYAEANGALPLSDRARLVAHAGVLRAGRGDTYASAPELVADGRAGIALDVDRFVVQLAWVGASSTRTYPAASGRRHAAVLTLTVPF